jgi:hypothetical protein
MPDALPDATLPISRLGTGSTNGSNNGRGWGFTHNLMPKYTDLHKKKQGDTLRLLFLLLPSHGIPI